MSRDRHASFMSAVAIAAGTLERIATEIRLLQRTEVGEVFEPFGKEQKGSSAMPHKRNPVLTERVCGLARVVRGNLLTALENTALWHERDISHSSAERVAFPDACAAVDYMALEMGKVLKGLEVRPERMLANLQFAGGVVFSQRVLLALVDSGLSREDAEKLLLERLDRELADEVAARIHKHEEQLKTITEEKARTTMLIPLFATMTDEEQTYVIDALHEELAAA